MPVEPDRTLVSVITATLNSRETVRETMFSIAGQSHLAVERVIVDGGSTDDTVALVKESIRDRDILVSERDEGIYDALNKGFRLSRGNIIGFLQSDDVYADSEVLRDVVAAFEDPGVDAVYGDLEYVRARRPRNVVRTWVAGPFDRRKFSAGWMPPHPTLFLRRRVVTRWGGYDASFKIAGDYDAILRYFLQGRILARYVPRVLVRMRTGGVSNRSLKNLLVKSSEDYRALRTHRAGGLRTLAMKNLSKVRQFLPRW